MDEIDENRAKTRREKLEKYDSDNKDKVEMYRFKLNEFDWQEENNI